MANIALFGLNVCLFEEGHKGAGFVSICRQAVVIKIVVGRE